MTMTVKNFNHTAEAKGFTTSVDAALGLILLKHHDTTVWAIAIHKVGVASQLAPLELNKAIQAQDLAEALANTDLVDRYADIFELF
ncbi:hypothetical protein [Limosilactobacillus allomucosae]|uniref:Uncharacterized protein n=1 Tax=Limosilactobacillus allomucosae TaxID=3142938 RepID=A0AAU7C5C1_9LACO